MGTRQKKPSPEDVLLNERCRILVVDDDPMVRMALDLTLQNEGYEVRTAEEGYQALKIMKQFAPAIIICDQQMPGMSGIETLQKSQEVRPDTIRMLLTGNTELETAIEAINVGHVNHYISKPWDNSKLQKTIQGAIEKYKLGRENKILQELILSQHAKLAKAHNSLLEEVKLGARVQEKLLFGKVPNHFNGVTIDAFSYPSQSIDGDFIEFYHQSPHILDLVFGDVMGKGLAAALIGIAVKTQLIRFAHPAFFPQVYTKDAGWISPPLSPDAILSKVHKEIVPQLIDLEHFVTLIYGRLDTLNGTFSFIDCGSTKPLHFNGKTRKAAFLSGSNLPLGVSQQSNYQTETIRIGEGDLLIFYSDGITEARSPSGEFFGTDRLVRLVENHSHLPVKDISDLVKHHVFAFSCKQQLDDDLTFIVMKINHFPQENHPKHMSERFGANLSQLAHARNFVRQMCSEGNGDRARLAHEFELVIDEVMTNIIFHGGLQEGTQWIDVQGEHNEEGIWIKISDQGNLFDPSAVREPSFAGDRTTGFGWHLIREIADVICYKRKDEDDGWNHLSIFKRYHPMEKKP